MREAWMSILSNPVMGGRLTCSYLTMVIPSATSLAKPQTEISALLPPRTVHRGLGPDRCLPARLERVEIVSPARIGVYAGDPSQPHTIDPPRIVVYACHIGAQCTIDPKRQAAIVRAAICRSPPINFNWVWCIADGKPTRVRPGRGVVSQGGPQLIAAVAEAELNSHHDCRCT